MKASNTHTVHLNKREYKAKVHDYTFSKDWKYKGDIPAVIDFYANWCVPCKMVAPILDELSIEYAGKVKIYKIDSEKDPEVSKAYGISSIPTLMFIPLDGKPTMVTGAQSRGSLKSNIERILPRDGQPLIKKLLSFKW